MQGKPYCQNAPLRSRQLAGALLAVLAVFAQPVAGDTLDTFYITAGVTRQHDDNLFRLPSGLDLKPYIGRSSSSEIITTTSVMLNINKAYSLQRFELQAGFNDYRYRNFSYLDFTARPYKAAWHWSMTPSLHGVLLTERIQSATSFTDYRGYNKSNTETQEHSRFNAEYDLNASWHLLGAVYQRTNENTEQTQGEDDSRTDSAEIGVRYSLPSGNSLRYLYRDGRGDYLNRRDPILFGLTDNGFDDREHALALNWRIGGKTTLDARLAWLEREHDHYAARDYDGTVGNLTLNWTATGKSFVRASVARELGSNQTFYSSYTETDRLSVMPYWQISGKTALRLQYDVAWRDYLGAIAQTSYNGRSDTVRTSLLALEWTPMRDVTLSVSGRRETRDSNRPGLGYESNVFMASGTLGF